MSGDLISVKGLSSRVYRLLTLTPRGGRGRRNGGAASTITDKKLTTKDNSVSQQYMGLSRNVCLTVDY